jgi:hypothetical protein
MQEILNKISLDSVQVAYGALAVAGGVARYLNNVVQGGKFNIWLFIASTFVSGFSGYMFALLGCSLQLPNNFIFMMAGIGGFFGDQTMHFLLEYVQGKAEIT